MAFRGILVRRVLRRNLLAGDISWESSITGVLMSEVPSSEDSGMTVMESWTLQSVISSSQELLDDARPIKLNKIHL